MGRGARRQRQGAIAERLGVVFLVLDLWRRLPPKRRRQVLMLARKHGPRVVRRIYRARRARRRV